MVHLIKEEFNALGQFIKNNGSEIIIVVFATLFISLDKYQPIGSEWVSTLVYYGIFPLLVIMIILRKNPLDFGLRWGSPRIWGFYTIVICVIAAGILYASSYSSALQKYYQNQDFSIVTYSLTSLVSLWASEFIYRGFLLFGLREKFKEGSILLQMVPFALLHLGKPELETLSTIFTGLLFGFVAYRGKSFWPAFIIHLFINIFFVVLINLKYPAH
jgi:membrane protease YdiL (CAAX protease family)